MSDGRLVDVRSWPAWVVLFEDGSVDCFRFKEAQAVGRFVAEVPCVATPSLMVEDRVLWQGHPQPLKDGEALAVRGV